MKTPRRSVLVTATGVIFLGIATSSTIAVVGAIAERGLPDVATGMMYLIFIVPFAYIGAAMIWRWKNYRLKTKAFSWVMIVIAVAGGIAQASMGGPQELILPLVILVLFGFVLWGLHRETAVT
jgi:hypothetical protein